MQIFKRNFFYALGFIILGGYVAKYKCKKFIRYKKISLYKNKNVPFGRKNNGREKL